MYLMGGLLFACSFTSTSYAGQASNVSHGMSHCPVESVSTKLSFYSFPDG